MRGNLTEVVYQVGCFRTIPACAGEPCRELCCIKYLTDYPRVCGGTKSMSTSSASFKGLSPRVRGNRDSKCRLHSIPRTIPACAGEPTYSLTDLRNEMDYPRVCGGTLCVFHSFWKYYGLSPRVRGNQIQNIA